MTFNKYENIRGEEKWPRCHECSRREAILESGSARVSATKDNFRNT
jgi:hypothetical protein